MAAARTMLQRRTSPVRPRMTTTATVTGNSIGIVHDAALSTNTRFLYGCFSCNSCCWSKIKKRTHVQVHENRIESNYPCYPICCLGCCCLTDCVTTKYFDQIDSTITVANGCTCYHCCGIWPCCGGVVAHAPTECQNNDACRCTGCGCATTYPGLLNAPLFAAYANEARAAFMRGERLVPAPLRQMMDGSGGKEPNGAHMHPSHGGAPIDPTTIVLGSHAGPRQPYGAGVQLIHVGGIHNPNHQNIIIDKNNNNNGGSSVPAAAGGSSVPLSSIPIHPTHGLPVAMPVRGNLMVMSTGPAGSPPQFHSAIPLQPLQQLVHPIGMGMSTTGETNGAPPTMVMDIKGVDASSSSSSAEGMIVPGSTSTTVIMSPPSYIAATEGNGGPNVSVSSPSQSSSSLSSRGHMDSTHSNSTIDVPVYSHAITAAADAAAPVATPPPIPPKHGNGSGMGMGATGIRTSGIAHLRDVELNTTSTSLPEFVTVTKY